jgi:hypothetical protein
VRHFYHSIQVIDNLFSYKKRRLLTGILYFHNISNTRVGGIAVRNLRLFEELVGDDPLKSVIVVTNMWKLVDEDLGGARELELKTDPDFFKGIHDQGGIFMRHLDTKDSAFKILRYLLDRKLAPGKLTIQIEMVDEKLTLDETNAAAALMRDFDQLISNLGRRIDREEKFIASGRGTSQDRSESEKTIQKMRTKLRELEARKKSLQRGGSISLQKRFIKFVKIFGLRL